MGENYDHGRTSYINWQQYFMGSQGGTEGEELELDGTSSGNLGCHKINSILEGKAGEDIWISSERSPSNDNHRLKNSTVSIDRDTNNGR